MTAGDVHTVLAAATSPAMGKTEAWMILAVLALLGVWLASFRSHPYRVACPKCDGRGWYRHPIIVWSRRRCNRCGAGPLYRSGPLTRRDR